MGCWEPGQQHQPSNESASAYYKTALFPSLSTAGPAGVYSYSTYYYDCIVTSVVQVAMKSSVLIWRVPLHAAVVIALWLAPWEVRDLGVSP